MSFLHIIKSASYNTDGRLLKWLKSLSENKIPTEVFILEDNNIKGVFKDNDINIISISLRFRRCFKKGKGYVFKVPELTIKTLSYIFRRKPDVILFHDLQHYLSILTVLLFIKPFTKTKVLWDLHELPHNGLTSNFITKKILRFMLSHCDFLIYTNKERRAYILEKINHREKDYYILNNYPSRDYVNVKKADLPDGSINTLGDTPYILWLGAAAEGRNFNTFLTTYKNYKGKYKLVILGKVDDKFKEEIDGLKREGHVFTDFVPQIDMIKYIDNAYFSVVLYRDTSPNNRFCEPNRLYQLLTRNIPIICGNNPTMKSIIEENGGGIVLPDDGSSLETMEMAMMEMVDNYNVYKESEYTYKNTKLMTWDSQFDGVYKKLLEL
ncbi:glycosyltransferase family protein [Sphingobacterium arenae]|uniref:Glycosyltransferase n=1 Tax=Sphingobacterium arenae TaxID=1280598 RepID=A0ABR7Y8V5_9SPHI|nr:hypothetical protein [Sphingobacterium arenae]MBD1427739.1 hypothetical protein [Sphingobacterium arenae]